MLSVQLLLVAFMALLVSTSLAQSSSSTGSQNLSSSSSSIPTNDSDSSIIVIASSSSSTGSSWISSSSIPSVDYLPIGTMEVGYVITLTSTTVPSEINDALADDFAATIAPSFNSTTGVIRPYILIALNLSSLNTAARRLLTTEQNISVTATVLGNVSEVVSGAGVDTARNGAAVFAAAIANRTVITTAATAVIPSMIVPDQVVTISAVPQPSSSTGHNGAASSSASFLIGAALAALTVLAF